MVISICNRGRCRAVWVVIYCYAMCCYAGLWQQSTIWYVSMAERPDQIRIDALPADFCCFSVFSVLLAIVLFLLLFWRRSQPKYRRGKNVPGRQVRFYDYIPTVGLLEVFDPGSSSRRAAYSIGSVVSFCGQSAENPSLVLRRRLMVCRFHNRYLVALHSH